MVGVTGFEPATSTSRTSESLSDYLCTTNVVGLTSHECASDFI